MQFRALNTDKIQTTFSNQEKLWTPLSAAMVTNQDYAAAAERVKKASAEHVCSLCWKGHTPHWVHSTFHSTFLMSKVLWGLKGLMFEGSFHHFWLQMRIFKGAVSEIILEGP